MHSLLGYEMVLTREYFISSMIGSKFLIKSCFTQNSEYCLIVAEYSCVGFILQLLDDFTSTDFPGSQGKCKQVYVVNTEHMHACACVRARVMCVCVCVCVREKCEERERESVSALYWLEKRSNGCALSPMHRHPRHRGWRILWLRNSWMKVVQWRFSYGWKIYSIYDFEVVFFRTHNMHTTW